MKICIVGPRREGKTRLLNHLRESLKTFGAEFEIWDGGEVEPAEILNKGGTPYVEVLITNDVTEAAEFVQEAT